ncbi:WXG100 family type VII secretion target [Actinokineospora cianjurensis]|uniref:Excreted virulence factor EspC (Type VII ESX diderm) n=1 Tax=Actinokineospora cianjurensis TaxID=585224 RepID=A0A421B034_9PSEU|nr:hypothetical protein [Actinokineospora cianjurensis]RLK55384.1 hypothetical protein CLV68_4869 [Actinokineospora cianjurensis]
MSSGYTVDTTSLAIRVGELRALADEVEVAANRLSLSAGDLGPGDIAAAAQEVADQWRDDLGAMRDKIGKIADNVRSVVADYEQVEQGGADRMRLAVERGVAEAQLNALRGGAAAQQARLNDLTGGKP